MKFQKDIEQRLKVVLSDPSNQNCSECDREENTPAFAAFVVAPSDEKILGVVCCKKCSKLFTKVEGADFVVKKLDESSDWTKEDVEALEVGGNALVNACYEAKLTKQDLKDKERREIRKYGFEAFFFEKYVNLTFYDETLYRNLINQSLKSLVEKRFNMSLKSFNSRKKSVVAGEATEDDVLCFSDDEEEEGGVNRSSSETEFEAIQQTNKDVKQRFNMSLKSFNLKKKNTAFANVEDDILCVSDREEDAKQNTGPNGWTRAQPKSMDIIQRFNLSWRPVNARKSAPASIVELESNILCFSDEEEEDDTHDAPGNWASFNSGDYSTQFRQQNDSKEVSKLLAEKRLMDRRRVSNRRVRTARDAAEQKPAAKSNIEERTRRRVSDRISTGKAEREGKSPRRHTSRAPEVKVKEEDRGKSPRRQSRGGLPETVQRDGDSPTRNGLPENGQEEEGRLPRRRSRNSLRDDVEEGKSPPRQQSNRRPTTVTKLIDKEKRRLSSHRSHTRQGDSGSEVVQKRRSRSARRLADDGHRPPRRLSRNRLPQQLQSIDLLVLDS